MLVPQFSLRCFYEWLARLCLATFLAGMTVFSGHIGWGIWDQNGVSQLIWLLKNGDIPYQTLYTAVPPIFIFGAKLGAILPARYWSVLVINAGFTALIFVLASLLLRRAKLSSLWALILPATVLMSTTVVTGFWWYNGATFAIQFLWMCLLYDMVQRDACWGDILALGLLATVLLWCKPHTSLVLYGSFLVYALCYARRWLCSVPVTVGLLLLTPIQWMGYIRGLILNSGRAHFIQGAIDHWLLNGKLSKDVLIFHFSILSLYVAFSLLFVGIAVAAFLRFPPLRSRWLLVGGVLGAGLLSFCSDNILVTELAGFWVGLALLSGAATGSARLQRMLSVGCLGLLVLSSLMVFRHTRPHYHFDRSRPHLQVGLPAFFDHIHSGDRLPVVISELNTAFRVCHLTTSSSVLLGPCLEFGYPMLGLIPPRPHLYCWEGFRDSPTLVTAAIQAPVEAWIFVYSGENGRLITNHYPDDLLAFIQGHPVIYRGKTIVVYGKSLALHTPPFGHPSIEGNFLR